MVEIRKLNFDGIEFFKTWLLNPDGGNVPPELFSGAEYTEIVDGQIDENRIFSSRYEFGRYLNQVFAALSFKDLMHEDNDGLWAWLAVVYFNQLTVKGVRRREHYVVERNGPMGSLAYRQATRTCYELVYIHGQKSSVCLGVEMHTYGDMTEQLASRQTLAHNRGFFDVAFNLYVRDGKLSRGASSRVKAPKKRKTGDKTGFGGGGRLALALKRLDITFDTEIMEAFELIEVLPREFQKWTK